MAFHSRCSVDGVPEQTVSWISGAYNVCYNRTAMKAHAYIDKPLLWLVRIDKRFVCSNDGINGKLCNPLSVVIGLILDEVCYSCENRENK